MTDEPQRLNHQFGLADHVNFKAGPGELTVAEINDAMPGVRPLYRGARISFQPHGQQPVLWVSQQSQYKIGRAIRGGIPVTWPWFADHPTDPTKPAHGFVRTASWSITATVVVGDGATRLRLGLSDNDHSRALWPHAFRLELVITVGPALQVELLMQNPGAAAFTCGGALHSYFGVNNTTRIVVHGLAGCTYIDKVDGGRRKLQRGPVTIESETDRIYLETSATCVVEDSGWGRRIQIAKSGSRSTVVWNPWIDKARQMADFGDEEYRGMVCVETTNAAEDIVTVAPGGEHRLRAVISLSPQQSREAKG